MPDKDTVLKAINCCIEQCGIYCPYWSNGLEYSECVNKLLKDAGDLIKGVEKKPKEGYIRMHEDVAAREAFWRDK